MVSSISNFWPSCFQFAIDRTSRVDLPAKSTFYWIVPSSAIACSTARSLKYFTLMPGSSANLVCMEITQSFWSVPTVMTLESSGVKRACYMLLFCGLTFKKTDPSLTLNTYTFPSLLPTTMYLSVVFDQAKLTHSEKVWIFISWTTSKTISVSRWLSIPKDWSALLPAWSH